MTDMDRKSEGVQRTSVTAGLSGLFRRDLLRLRAQIDAFSSDDALWQTLPGFTNSAGNLALHLEGNLREYIGRRLGDVSYVRDRPLEFSAKDLPKAEIVARMDALSRLISEVVASLSDEQMEKEYPEVVLEAPMSTQDFLLHLYAHLSWHSGQIDALRRITV